MNRSSARSRRSALLASAVGAVAAATALAATGAPATARSPHQVDPASVTPSLNPGFAPWTCWEAGAGIICDGSNEGSYAEPAWFDCVGVPVYHAGTFKEQMTRWHTAEGLATRTLVKIAYPDERFTLTEDGSGPAVVANGNWMRHYVYPVPGDLATRVMTETGVVWRVRGPEGQHLFRDVGFVEFAPGSEDPAMMHGVHEMLADPAAAEGEICDALV